MKKDLPLKLERETLPSPVGSQTTGGNHCRAGATKKLNFIIL
ncbi:hypothetical protein QUA79_21065 [Microcoleus sp. F8-D1]